MTAPPPFASVLVANRGEIAVRVVATLRRLGIRAIAVYSQADAGAPHVRLADRAIEIGPPPARDSYLRGDAIVAAARRCGAEAIHPGYGLLSERADFAQACADAGVTFVGPSPQALALLGDKVAAKRLAAAAGVPVLAGVAGDDDEIAAWAAADAARLPLIVKAAAGGGGRGMRVVRALDELRPALAAARREATAAFGDGALLAERYVERGRHVEVQLLADAHGAVVHLGERECSLQRRHQKLVEECPSPAVDAPLRARLGAAAVALARAAGYAGAGTCEFLVGADEPGDAAFLEVNPRLQVEHPVTELVYGIDLVEAQLRLAAGEPLWLRQDELVARGHAIEARVCAERAERGFVPATGRVVAYREPAGAGVRVDSAVARGSEVGPHYDSLVCKVIAHGPSRGAALARLDGALAQLVILGPPVTTAYLRALLADPAVRAGALDTGLVARLAPPATDRRAAARAAVACALTRLLADERGDDPWERLVGWRIDGVAPQRYALAAGDDAIAVVVDGGRRAAGALADATVRVRVGGDERALPASAALAGDELTLTLDGDRRVWACARDGDLTHVGIDGGAWAFGDHRPRLRDAAIAAGCVLEAPMPGAVLDVRVRPGDDVAADDVLVVLESMKMELELVAPAAGTVERVAVAAGDRVGAGQLLVALGAGP